MASRPDLRLKEGLQKLRDYRAVHRKNLSCFDAGCPRTLEAFCVVGTVRSLHVFAIRSSVGLLFGGAGERPPMLSHVAHRR